MSGRPAARESSLAAAVAREGLDTVAGSFAWSGGSDLDKPGLGDRRRTKFELTDAAGEPHTLYLKRYGPDGWAAGVRRWVTDGRKSPGRVEAENIQMAAEAGLTSMAVVAWGEEPFVLRSGRSYVVVTAVAGDALERCFEAWLAAAADEAVRRITAELADLVARLHRAGLVHRDLYASHIFLDVSGEGPLLSLIDLARAFRPRCRRFRWRVKDLAALKYSMPPAWVDGWWPAFLEEYAVRCGPAVDPRQFRNAVERKASWMRRRHHRKAAMRTAESTK